MILAAPNCVANVTFARNLLSEMALEAQRFGS
jgi:hypothetical protein